MASAGRCCTGGVTKRASLVSSGWWCSAVENSIVVARAQVVVLGTHPWCCTNDEPILRTVQNDIFEVIKEQRARHPQYPVALLGDMNPAMQYMVAVIECESLAWASTCLAQKS